MRKAILLHSGFIRVLAIVHPLCYHRRGCLGLLIVDPCLSQRSLWQKRGIRDSERCNAFSRPRVTSSSPSADATPLKRGSQRQLACDVVLLWLPWIHSAVCLWNMPRRTEHHCGLPKQPNLTFYTSINIFNLCFQPEACDAKGNWACKERWVRKYCRYDGRWRRKMWRVEVLSQHLALILGRSWQWFACVDTKY